MSEKVCDHHGSVVQRRRVAIGGGCYVQGQCTICRSAVGPKLRVALGEPLAQNAPYWLQDKKPTAKKRRQAKTLKSRRWQELRLAVLARDSYVCRSCGGLATTVHHLPGSYGEEEEANLIAACNDCQLAERSARITSQVLGTKEVRH